MAALPHVPPHSRIAEPRRSSSLRRLALATGLASAGLAAGGTGGALLISDVTGTDSAAGAPFAFVVAGSAAGAVLISSVTRRAGRERALAGGYLAGMIGAFVVMAGGVASSVPFVLAGSLLLGPANAAVFLSRYAGADLAAEADRGRALGYMLFVTAAGAVLAPNLLAPADTIADAFGLARYSGLYLVAALAFGLSAAMSMHRARRPATSASHVPRNPSGPVPLAVDRRRGPGSASSRIRRASAPLVVLAAANMSMVGIMAIVPVHLSHHGHHLGAVGFVISAHVLAMFGPSPLSGWLCDRLGARPVAMTGGFVLLVAGVAAALTGDATLGPTTASLVVLGLGWNLAVVAGSAMLTAGLPPRERPRLEAAGEVAMGAAAAIGAAAAGILAASRGWPVMATAGGLVGAAALAAAGAKRDEARSRLTGGGLPELAVGCQAGATKPVEPADTTH